MHQGERAGSLWWPKSLTHTSKLAQLIYYYYHYYYKDDDDYYDYDDYSTTITNSTTI